MRVAIIISDIVSNVIEADSLASAETIFPDAECIDADISGVSIGYARDGETWTQPAQVEPEPPAPTPSLYAIAQLQIDSGSVTSIAPSARISGAFPVDVGVYWVFFAEPLPDANYMVLCYNQGHSVHVSEQYEDFFVITATSGGVPSDPQCISVEVKRVI